MQTWSSFYQYSCTNIWDLDYTFFQNKLQTFVWFLYKHIDLEGDFLLWNFSSGWTQRPISLISYYLIWNNFKQKHHTFIITVSFKNKEQLSMYYILNQYYSYFSGVFC